jgi:hypothetical protein
VCPVVAGEPRCGQRRSVLLLTLDVLQLRADHARPWFASGHGSGLDVLDLSAVGRGHALDAGVGRESSEGWTEIRAAVSRALSDFRQWAKRPT